MPHFYREQKKHPKKSNTKICFLPPSPPSKFFVFVFFLHTNYHHIDSYSEAWGPPQFQEKRSRSEKAILGALGAFRGILGAALGIGNSILGIRNSILGMASHDLINTKPTILGATLGAVPGIAANPPERFSFAPAFSERFSRIGVVPAHQSYSLIHHLGVPQVKRVEIIQAAALSGAPVLDIQPRYRYGYRLWPCVFQVCKVSRYTPPKLGAKPTNNGEPHRGGQGGDGSSSFPLEAIALYGANRRHTI